MIDQEMQGIGGQKLDMPSLCSANLWKTSERWDLMGKELFRLKDRHSADYCLGPTHEEAVTTLVAHQATLSYRQLPLLLYQVSIRPVLTATVFPVTSCSLFVFSEMIIFKTPQKTDHPQIQRRAKAEVWPSPREGVLHEGHVLL